MNLRDSKIGQKTAMNWLFSHQIKNKCMVYKQKTQNQKEGKLQLSCILTFYYHLWYNFLSVSKQEKEWNCAPVLSWSQKPQS